MVNRAELISTESHSSSKFGFEGFDQGVHDPGFLKADARAQIKVQTQVLSLAQRADRN